MNTQFMLFKNPLMTLENIISGNLHESTDYLMMIKKETKNNHVHGKYMNDKDHTFANYLLLCWTILPCLTSKQAIKVIKLQELELLLVANKRSITFFFCLCKLFKSNQIFNWLRRQNALQRTKKQFAVK